MVTSSHEKKFCVTGVLWREFTGHRRIPLTKVNDAELWYFLWSAPEQTGEQTIEPPVIWDVIAPIITSPLWNVSIYFLLILPLTISGMQFFFPPYDVFALGRIWRVLLPWTSLGSNSSNGLLECGIGTDLVTWIVSPATKHSHQYGKYDYLQRCQAMDHLGEIYEHAFMYVQSGT